MIQEAIEKIADKAKIRFNTPGHKGKLLNEDITEIDKEFPANLIKRAQKQTAKILGVKEIRFLNLGSSLGIKASLLNKKGLIVDKNCHQSILEVAKISDAKVVKVNQYSLKQIKEAINQNPQIDTVVITSPNYYGVTVGQEIAQFIKESGKTLYVDGAHGAHFLFRPDLFDTKVLHLADAFNISAHKTLPAYTQTAYLAINNKSLINQIDNNLKLLSTTSPFYPFYSQLEKAVIYTEQNKNNFDLLKIEIDKLKEDIVCVKNDDFTRLVVDSRQFNLTAKQLYFTLKERGIIAEKFDSRYVIFIISVMDKKEDIICLKQELIRLRRDNGKG